MIKIVALGPGSPDLLTLGAIKELRSCPNVLLRTARHGCAGTLTEQGIAWRALDEFYDRAADFDELCRLMAEEVIDGARSADVAYAVSDLSDATVSAVMKAANASQPAIEVRCLPGVTAQSFATAGVSGQWSVADALEWENLEINPRKPLIIRELDTQILASELKIRLLEHYPENAKVLFYAPGESASRAPVAIPLCELDRQLKYDHTALCLIEPVELTKLSRFDFYHLMEIIRMLRAPGGCPWDREQTHESLKRALIEECYEVLETIDNDDTDKMYDELGDVLLQVVFHSCIAEEHSDFTIDDVTTAVCRKMISRHTHIFGDAKAATAQDVLNNWEAIKKQEKGLQSYADVMRDVGRNLPALLRADKVQNKARHMGFDFDDAAQALPKVREEIEEVRAELDAGSDRAQYELGDLLFAAVNVARLAGVDPEQALTYSTDKFIKRVSVMEKMLVEDGKPVKEMPLAQWDEYWDKAKQFLRSRPEGGENG